MDAIGRLWEAITSFRVTVILHNITLPAILAILLLLVLLILALRRPLAVSGGIDRMNIWLGRLAAVLVLAAALISATNAFFRYAFDMSSNAYLEIQWYLFAAMVFFGASETLRKNEHVRVDLVYMAVSERKRLWIDIMGILLFLFPFTLLMVWLAWPVAMNMLRSGEVSFSAGGLVRWPVWMLLPLGFALVALQGLSELIKRFAALRGLVRVDTAYHKPDQ
jgi:TRAP-type mannitol/chloroaromatic compound transport system permease small subunit